VERLRRSVRHQRRRRFSRILERHILQRHNLEQDSLEQDSLEQHSLEQHSLEQHSLQRFDPNLKQHRAERLNRNPESCNRNLGPGPRPALE
jgi:hypothetical protein